MLQGVDDEPVHALDVQQVMRLILGPGGAHVTLWIAKAPKAGEPLPPLPRVPERAGDVSIVTPAVALAATPARDHHGAPAVTPAVTASVAPAPTPASAKAVQWPMAKGEVDACAHISEQAHATHTDLT